MDYIQPTKMTTEVKGFQPSLSGCLLEVMPGVKVNLNHLVAIDSQALTLSFTDGTSYPKVKPTGISLATQFLEGQVQDIGQPTTGGMFDFPVNDMGDNQWAGSSWVQ